MCNLYRRPSIVAVSDIGSDHWVSIFSEQSTNICRITTCNERRINRVHLTFSLYTNCQNRPCGKEFNTTASIMFTLTLQISKLTKAVVLNSFPHGRFWQFVYEENVRCTRLMQRSLQDSIDAPGQLLKVSVAYWAPIVKSVPQKALKKNQVFATVAM
jgi:hypothetical protein